MTDRPTPHRRGPRPGAPARGSDTGQPLSALFDLLGRRWALTCLWSLRDGPRTFREIQAVDPRISASTLNTRIAELRDAGLVQRGDAGYVATHLGLDLLRVGAPLAEWARTWAGELADRGAPDPLD